MLTRNGKLCMMNVASKAFKLTSGEMGNLQGSVVRQAAIACGSGNTPSTVDDYCLETPNNTLARLSNSCVINASYDNNFLETITSTFQNDTESDIIVTEIGALGGSSNNVLIAREVIDPVVIPANGGQKTFTITIG